jgi:hypothetical protein
LAKGNCFAVVGLDGPDVGGFFCSGPAGTGRLVHYPRGAAIADPLSGDTSRRSPAGLLASNNLLDGCSAIES